MSGLGLLPCLGRHFLRPENGAELSQQCESRHNPVCDQRLSAARPESQCPVVVEIGDTHQSGLGTEGVRRLGVGITAAVVKWEFMDSRQADQASAEPRGTSIRDSMSVRAASMRGTEHPYVRTSCACPPTFLNYRSGQGVSSGRDGRVGGMVEMARSQCWASICYLCVGVNWGGVSVMWCRRQWYGLGTVFGPSRGSVRLYQECTWLASIRVVVARVRRAITHGRCSRGGWAGVWGARRRRRLSRAGSDVWCVREPSTVTLRGRGRTSVAGASVTVPVTRRRTSAITLGSSVGTSTVPMSHFLFPCLEDGAVSIVREKLGVEKGKDVG